MEENKKTNTAIVRFSSGRGNQMEIKFPNVVSKKNAIEDIYIDSFTAEVYINYGKKDGQVRSIDSSYWKKSKDLSLDQRNSFLLENSKKVEVDDQQIQDMLQEIHVKTNYSKEKGKEHQVFICLESSSAIIKSFLGPIGTERNCFIPSSKVNNNTVVDVNGTKMALLGQVHTHPFITPREKHIPGGEMLYSENDRVNDYGTSKEDADLARDLHIYVYELDSWNFYKKTSKVSIYRVSPTGIMKKVGTTKGNGDASNMVNIGLECLNLKIGR
ncbi:hypothetical protein [Capnocytophaga gingivalis]|jgi:hypothetical protein